MSLVSPQARQAIKLQNPSGTKSDAGERAYSTAVSLMARVDTKTKLRRGPKGELVQSSALVIIPAPATVLDGCRISLDGGTTYRVALEVREQEDLAGIVDHYEVLL